MDSLLPSEIARLVLGYLEEECEVAAQSLLENCVYLQECYLMAQQGRTYSTKPYNKSLKQVLEEYCAIRCLVSDWLKKLPESSAASLTQCSLVEQLSHLMGLPRSGQTLLVSITMPPQGSGNGAVQASTSPLLSQGRARSRQSNSAERCRRLSVRWQGGEAQQPAQETEHVTSVEATPAKSLPGLLPNEDVESDRNHSSQKLRNKESPDCPLLEDSRIIAPIGSGSCTSTPKRKTSCSKRKGTPSTKGSPPSVKGTSSSPRMRRSLSEEEPNESISLTLLTQAFLENKELHQKIAENINKAIGAEQHVHAFVQQPVPPSAHQPVETSSGPSGPLGESSQEMDSVIKTIVEQTEQDPLFERFLEDLVGPIDPLVGDETEKEAEDGQEGHPCVDTRPMADGCDSTPRSNLLDIPLKQRLRNARNKKDSGQVETFVVQKEKSGSQTLEEKICKSSHESAAGTSGDSGSDCPVSLEHQNAVAIESIINANVFSPNKQSPPMLCFKSTLGHLVSSDIPDTSHDHNSIMSASCIDHFAKEVASMQSDKYQLVDGNVSLPSFGESFNLCSDTLKTVDSVKCVTSESTATSSSDVSQKQPCSSSEITVTISSHPSQVQQADPSKFPGETGVESRTVHCSSQQGSGVSSSVFSENPNGEGCTSLTNSGDLLGGKVVDSADTIFSATLSNDSSGKAVYSLVCISSQANTANTYGNFPSNYSLSPNRAALLSGPKTGSSSPVSVVSAGSQQSICSVASVMPQQIMSSSNKPYHAGSITTDSSKTCFSHPEINMPPSVSNQTLHFNCVGEGGENVCNTVSNFPHSSGCSDIPLSNNYVVDESATIITHVSKPAASGTALHHGQVLSIGISEEDGTVATQPDAGCTMPISVTEKGTVSISQPLTEAQLMQMPLILCGNEKNLQLINILNPAKRPTAPVVPVGSRKKGYIPILPKKERAPLSKKLIVIPSSPSLSQQLVVIPPGTDGNPVTLYSYPVSEEPVHFSDSNPCTQSLPAICLDSPVAKDHEGREQLLGALNLLESANKDSPNVSESVVSPQLMKLVDISKNTLSPTTETVSASEHNLSVTGNSVSHDAPPPLEIYPRNTPTVSSGLKQKGLNSRRLSLSTPRRKRNHIRTLDFNTPLKPTSIRKSNTSPKVSGKVISQTSPKMSKSVRRMSLFKSPVNRVSTQSTLNESQVDRDTTENNSADIVCPIATRSPATPLSGNWDKVTGAGLIIPESSPGENSETQTKKSVVDDGRELTESGSTDKHKIATKKSTDTWDSALRALLSPSYSDPEPPSKSTQSRKESRHTKKVAAEEARRIESELIKCSMEYISGSSSERSTIDTRAIEDSENRIVPQISTESKQSVKKRKRVRQTPLKENNRVPVENKNTSIKGLNRRVKSKQTYQSSCGICYSTDKKSPLEVSTERCVKTSKSPLRNKSKTPLKRTVKTPLKSSTKISLKRTVKTPLKSSTKISLKRTVKTPLKSSTKISLKRTVKTPLKSSMQTPLKQSPFKSKAKSPLAGKASRLTKCKNTVKKQPRQKSKSKVPNKIVKVCIEKIDKCNQTVLENGVNKNYSFEKMGNDEDSNITPIKPNVSEENPYTSDENKNKSKDGNSRLSGSTDALNAGICHTNNAVVEKNNSCIRKHRKNPSPSKNIHKPIEKEKDGITLDSEKKMSGGVFSTTESTTSKVVQSPTNLKAAKKRTLVRNQLMAGRKLDLSEECTDVNNDVTHPVPSCSQAALLDTPEKTDTGTDVSLMVPMTPRIVSPRIVEDTPITKLIKEHIATYKDTIMTPHFPCTPNIPITPRSLETDLINESSTGEYPSRSTDYSSCSSYYQPPDDPNHQQMSLEQVLIDECCRMEANKVAYVCEKTKGTTQNVTTVPDGKPTDSHKPSISVTETTFEQSESSQKEVSKTLKQTESLCESITKECLQTADQTEEAASRKPSGEKAITTIQENENVGKSVIVENQFASQVQDNQICSQIVGRHDSVKQVKEQKDGVVEKTKGVGTLAKIKTAANTTEVMSSTALPDKAGLISQQENENSHQCLSTVENVAKLKQNRNDVMNFVIEKENHVGDESIDGQIGKRSKLEDENRPATDEKHISSDKDVQKEHTEEECIESVVTCCVTPQDSNLNSDFASEEITDSLQQSSLQSVDKTKDASSQDEKCVASDDEMSLNNKETSGSCARTSVFIFTGKGAKTESKINSSFRNFRTKRDENSITTSDSDTSSSEESSSDDESTELINCMECENSKTEKETSNTGSTRKLNTSTESSTLSSELFGNCSDVSDEIKPTDSEDNKEKEADIHPSKNTFQQDTFKEDDSEETSTKTTAALQSEGPVTETISDTVQDDTSGSNTKQIAEQPNTALDLCLPDGKLWLELEEKRLRTLAKLKEPPKAKRRRSATEVSSKNCKEKTAGSISKMAAKDGKANEEIEISAVAETVKKTNKSHKQGVNAIAERLRMQQQAVAHSGTKLDSSREELHSTHTSVLTSEIELKLARMHGELETNEAVASVHNIGDKTKSKLSDKISPVRTLEDILSNTSSCDKDVKSRKRRHSSVGGRGSKSKNTGRPAAKFPKLSLRDRSVTSSRKGKVLEEKSNILSESDKPVLSDVPVTKINLSGNKKICVLEKGIVSAGDTGEHADSSLNLLGVRTSASASNSSELAEMVLASPDDDTALQKSAGTNKCTIGKDYSNTDVSSCQDATADGIQIALDSLSKNSLNSESNHVGQDIKSHISERDSSSSYTCKSVEKTTCEIQNSVSDELALKLSSGNILSSVPNKIHKDNLLPNSKNTVSRKISSLGCTSKKKDKKSSSSNKADIKENILEKGKETVSKKINKSLKKKVCGKGEEFEENASAAHCSREKICSQRDSIQYDNMTENEISNLKVNRSVTAKNEVSCQKKTKTNVPQSSEHRKKHEVSPNPPSLVKRNSSVKHSDCKERSIESETNLELADSVSKGTSDCLPGFTKNGGITENSSIFTTNELQAVDKMRMISSSHEQNLVIDQETYPVDSGQLLGESPAAAEGIMLSGKNEGGTVLPARDSTQVLSAHENLSSEHILETGVPVIEEDFASPIEKVIYISYENNGPHLECEPPSFEYSDGAVKLLVDDFEVTCNITPFYELLNLLPADEDESHAKECSTSVDHHKNKQNEHEETYKCSDQSLNSSEYGSHKVTDISLLRVPKKINDKLSENKDMISPLSSLYEGPKKEKVSHKDDKHLELHRLETHNDKDKCKEKRDFSRPRIHDYIPSVERHRGRLEMRERSRYLANSARNIFYRKSSERHAFQDSGSRHERNTKSSSKHFDESQEGRHRVKYIRYDSSSRSRSSDKPHFYANRRDDDSEDHDLRGRDSNRVKSAKQYTPEAFDDGVERSDSKYVRYKGRDEYYLHKKIRSEMLDERDRNHVKSTKLPSKIVDVTEGRSRSKNVRYSYWNRTSNSLYSHMKVRNKMHEKKERLKDPLKNTKSATRNKGSKGGESKISQSRLNSKIEEYGEPSVSNTYRDSLLEEKNLEMSYLSKTSKLSSSSVRKQSKSSRDKVLCSRRCSSSDISEQLCSGRSTKESSENKVSDEDSDYLCDSDPEQEMRSYPLEKSPVRQMCEDDLMTYALIGSPSRTQRTRSAERSQRVEHAHDEQSSSRGRSVPSSSNSINPEKDDDRALPPKKRKASSEVMSSHVEKKECRGSADPQTLLKKVGLENFLSVVHGEMTQP